MPVVVIGTGPVGLAAAAHLLDTGADLLEHYLEPLAALPALSSRIRLRTSVVAVARRGLDKVRSPGRARARCAGRRTIVVGAGHSTATSLLALAEVQGRPPG